MDGQNNNLDHVFQQEIMRRNGWFVGESSSSYRCSHLNRGGLSHSNNLVSSSIQRNFALNGIYPGNPGGELHHVESSVFMQPHRPRGYENHLPSVVSSVNLSRGGQLLGERRVNSGSSRAVRQLPSIRNVPGEGVMDLSQVPWSHFGPSTCVDYRRTHQTSLGYSDVVNVPRVPGVYEHQFVGAESSRAVHRASSMPLRELTALPVHPRNVMTRSTNFVIPAEGPNTSIFSHAFTPDVNAASTNVSVSERLGSFHRAELSLGIPQTLPTTMGHQYIDARQNPYRPAEIHSPFLQSGHSIIPQQNSIAHFALTHGEYEDEDGDIDIVSVMLHPGNGLHEDVSMDSSPTIVASGETRNRLLSEVNTVLTVFRNGGELNFEEMMLSASSIAILLNWREADSEMHVDLENMSYEELLELEEQLGNENTGLSKAAIVKYLKTVNYYTPRAGSNKAESCCICQDEFEKGVKLGRLDCGHDFHKECIRKWLLEKNVCPICRSTALGKAVRR